jgi:RNA polymerase sigma factor (sigma-70 family)
MDYGVCSVETMNTLPKLALIFLESVRGRVVTPDEVEEIEKLLQRAHETGRAAWPQVTLAAEVFVRHLSQVLPIPGTVSPLAQALEQALETWDLPSLYLACACMHDVPSASETLERDILARLPTLLDPSEFRSAVREAFATLSPRQRYLLRLHFIDRLSTAEMGKLYSVDQSTVSRWLRSARQAVFEETKRRLMERRRL